MAFLDNILGGGGGLLQQQPQQSPLGPLGAGMLGFFNSKSPMSAIGNLLGGLMTGQRTDPQGMQMQALQASYNALRQSGVPDATAQAAALNPEIMKTIAGNYFDTKPQFGVIGTDQMGVNQYGFIRPNQMSITPASQAMAQNGQTPVASPIDPSLNGQGLLDAISKNPQMGPGEAQKIKGIAEGRIPYPTGFIMKTPYGRWLTSMVGQYEPGIDATKINERATFNRQMGSATPTSWGGQVQSSGTIVKHLGDALSALPALESGALGASDTLNQLNPVKNYIRSQTGDKQYLDAAGQYQTAVKGIAGEMERLLSGSQGAEASKKYWMDRLDINAAPTERRAALDQVRSLMMGRLSNIAEQKDRVFGTQTDPLSLLGQKEQGIAQQLMAGRYGQQPTSTNAAPANTAPTAVNPKTGQRIILKNGQWVPLQ